MVDNASVQLLVDKASELRSESTSFKNITGKMLGILAADTKDNYGAMVKVGHTLLDEPLCPAASRELREQVATINVDQVDRAAGKQQLLDSLTNAAAEG